MGVEAADRRLSLTQLEGDDWGPPPYGSHVVTRSHAYRDVPIGALTTEGLRLLIGQGIGLPYLRPIALEALARDPLACGDFYDGDLLMAVLRSDAALPFDAREGARLRAVCRALPEGALGDAPEDLARAVRGVLAPDA